MKFDFTTIMDRRGKDSIAADCKAFPGALANATVREGFDTIPMWVADMNFPTVPAVTKAIIDRASHPAFGYFADDYSLTQYALEEHGKEADAKHMTEIIDLAKKEDIKVIFYQAEISGRQAAAFAEEIGGTAVCLEPLAADYTENLRKMAKTLAEAMN